MHSLLPTRHQLRTECNLRIDITPIAQDEECHCEVPQVFLLHLFFNNKEYSGHRKIGVTHVPELAGETVTSRHDEIHRFAAKRVVYFRMPTFIRAVLHT